MCIHSIRAVLHSSKTAALNEHSTQNSVVSLMTHVPGSRRLQGHPWAQVFSQTCIDSVGKVVKCTVVYCGVLWYTVVYCGIL